MGDTVGGQFRRGASHVGGCRGVLAYGVLEASG